MNQILTKFQLSVVKKTAPITRRGLLSPSYSTLSASVKKITSIEMNLAIKDLKRGMSDKYCFNFKEIQHNYMILKSKLPETPGILYVLSGEIQLAAFSSESSLRDIVDGNVFLNGKMTGFAKWLFDTMLSAELIQVNLIFQSK
jgi:hypothetical protein